MTSIRNQSSAIASFGTKIVELLQGAIKAEIESMSNATKQFNSSSQDVVPVNSTYAIHVSKALKETTIDDIANLIVSKSNLNAESFKVEILSTRRYRGKNREFSSFKISTFTRDIFDKIMNDDIWKPDCIAKPFIYKDSTMKQDKYNRDETNALNKNKDRGKQAPQKPNVNTNSYVAPQPKNNNNKKNNNRNSNGINNECINNKNMRNEKSQRSWQNQNAFDDGRHLSQQQLQQQQQQQQQHQKHQQQHHHQQQQRHTFDNGNSYGHNTERATQHYSGVPFGYHQPYQRPHFQQSQHMMPSQMYAPNFLPFRGFQPMYQPF